MTERRPGPDFMIIDAMKCGTSTLHEQLAVQPLVFMTTPKGPNFFSDDEVYGRGIGCYEALFPDAPEDALRGESSTHYTKLPTHPATVSRVLSHYPDLRLIYVMRDPLQRMVSHFVHEWTECRIDLPFERALERHPELVAYSEQGRQLQPWRDAFGDQAILPVLAERLWDDPQDEFDRIGHFLGLGSLRWSDALERSNDSAERLRESPLRDAVLERPLARTLRRALVPKAVRSRVRRLWQMRERPQIPREREAVLTACFDADLARLDDLLGRRITSAEFSGAATESEAMCVRRGGSPGA